MVGYDGGVGRLIGMCQFGGLWRGSVPYTLMSLHVCLRLRDKTDVWLLCSNKVLHKWVEQPSMLLVVWSSNGVVLSAKFVGRSYWQWGHPMIAPREFCDEIDMIGRKHGYQTSCRNWLLGETQNLIFLNLFFFFGTMLREGILFFFL